MMNLPGGPTPKEVMAVSLQKLNLRKGDIAADLGCGTGTVTREIAKTASFVYAVDARPDAVSCTKETCAGLNVEIIEGEVTDFLLSPHKKIDCAFLGGSRNLSEILT
ncbi:MAG TPA: methyltransferase domain-containing protein, partial [Methanocorpusculum sp.]|nr:methyltransferase domain-containing protein [Methanocorpusculum sp.]